MRKIDADFVHLHVHSQYSFLNSTIRFDALLQKAKAYRMPAIALTDNGNLFGAIEFYQQAMQAGIKPIIGCELYVAPKSRFDKSVSNIADAAHHLVVLVKDMQGYKNLMRLVTAGYIEGFFCCPRVDKEILAQCHKGLIATSACLKGEMPSLLLRGERDAAIKAASEYQQIFGKGNFYLEIMENGLPEQKIINKGVLEISRLLSIPVVATNDCRYIQSRDAAAHNLLTSIQKGKVESKKRRQKTQTNQLYFRSPEEMKKIFSYCPDAIANTVRIAEMCNVKIDLSRYDPNTLRLADIGGHFEEVEKREIKKIMSLTGADTHKEKMTAFFQYLTRKYGRDRVARIISFKRFREKSARRYVENSVSDDMISKKDSMAVCETLEGLYYQSSIHSSSIVVADKPLIDTVPLYASLNGEMVALYKRNDLLVLGMQVFDVRV